MQEIEAVGVLSVRRGCGFGALAIVTLMFGLSPTPPIAFGAGSVSFLLMALVLLLKRESVKWTDYRKTELWLMLDKEKRPPAAVAAAVIPRILSDVYLTHFRYALAIAVILGVPTIGWHLAG